MSQVNIFSVAPVNIVVNPSALLSFINVFLFQKYISHPYFIIGQLLLMDNVVNNIDCINVEVVSLLMNHIAVI